MYQAAMYKNQKQFATILNTLFDIKSTDKFTFVLNFCLLLQARFLIFRRILYHLEIAN